MLKEEIGDSLLCTLEEKIPRENEGKRARESRAEKMVAMAAGAS